MDAAQHRTGRIIDLDLEIAPPEAVIAPEISTGLFLDRPPHHEKFPPGWLGKRERVVPRIHARVISSNDEYPKMPFDQGFGTIPGTFQGIDHLKRSFPR
jgi:hypothetical protein